MKRLRAAYEFVTGGSIAAPIGVAAAFAVAYLTGGLPPAARAAAFAATALLAFFASTLESAR
jgi:hypothetical protein